MISCDIQSDIIIPTTTFSDYRIIFIDNTIIGSTTITIVIVTKPYSGHCIVIFMTIVREMGVLFTT